MIKQKKILLVLNIIPTGLYFIGFYINWRAALFSTIAVIIATALNETWKSYKQ